MVHDVEMISSHALNRQSIVSLLLALVYLSLLIVPCMLTCIIALNPHVLVKYDRNYSYEAARAYSLNYTILTAIDILNTLALVLSLPLLSFLLSRAAIGFTQRQDEKQKLTVRQLFGLADQGWWNPFLIFRRAETSALLVFGWVLLALAMAMPLVRSGTVSHQSISFELGQSPYISYSNSPYEMTLIGSSPGPGLLQSVNGQTLVVETGTRLQSTTGGIESNLWPYCNDQNLTRYYKRTCGFDYSPYDMSQSALSNFWETSLPVGDVSSESFSQLEPQHNAMACPSGL